MALTKSKIVNYILSIVAVAVCSAGSAIAYSGENLATNAKITMEQAIAIAQKARPGTITDKELEREGGGSGLRYSFDIKAGSHTYEVGVDAVTGKVLENGSEGRNPD
jgi:uncharacterized membrane protein YkoI